MKNRKLSNESLKERMNNLENLVLYYVHRLEQLEVYLTKMELKSVRIAPKSK